MSKEVKNFYRSIYTSFNVDDLEDKYKYLVKDGKVERKILDYEKVYDDEFPIWLVITERGARAKTTEAKRLARILANNNIKTMWIMNTMPQIKNEKGSHLSKPHKYLINQEFTGQEKVIGKKLLKDKGDENSWYQTFTTLSTAENEKGSRDDYGLLIYDEFNVAIRQMKNSQTNLISSLIGTMGDQVNIGENMFSKFIIHGNYKTLNHPWLIDMKIYSITKEITEIFSKKGKPLLKIFIPQMSEKERKEIEALNDNNWQYQLQERMGKVDHVYYNKSLFDEINSINPNKIFQASDYAFYLKIDNKYFKLHMQKGIESKELFLETLNKKPDSDNITSIYKRDTIEGVSYNSILTKDIFNFLQKGLIYFSDIIAREYLLSRLK